MKGNDVGYDMYVRHESGEKLCDVAEGTLDWSRFDELTEDEKREVFDTRWQPKYYLRRSIGGQPSLREALIETGAAFADYDFETGWAAIVGKESHVMGRAFPANPGDEHFDEQGNPTTDTGREYTRQVEAYLRWRPERPGIPIHKLCDNSGWIVTAEECEEALEAIRAWTIFHDGELPAAFSDDVIPFLESASKHAGFEVW